jgi:hypothetical protein
MRPEFVISIISAAVAVASVLITALLGSRTGSEVGPDCVLRQAFVAVFSKKHMTST